MPSEERLTAESVVVSLTPSAAKYVASLLRNDRAKRVKHLDWAVSHNVIQRREFALEQIEAIDSVLVQLEPADAHNDGRVAP